MKIHIKKYPQVEMLPLETNRYGGKLLPHWDLGWGGECFLEEVSRNRKRDIVLGTWNVRSLYRAGSLMAVARELARYKLDLAGVQEVKWDKGGTVRAGEYNFFYGKGWWGNLRERDHWGNPDVDGRIILRWILRKWEGVVGTGWSWLRIGTGGGRLWVR